jgi:hypothetical protein
MEENKFNSNNSKTKECQEDSLQKEPAQVPIEKRGTPVQGVDIMFSNLIVMQKLKLQLWEVQTRKIKRFEF